MSTALPRSQRTQIKEKAPRLAKFTLGLAAAAMLAGMFGQALAAEPASAGLATKTDNAVLARVVQKVYTAALKGTPDPKVNVYFTDDDKVTDAAMAVSDVRQAGCQVVINNKVLDRDFTRALIKATGWDDETAAIYIIGHELQHCVTSQDVHAALAKLAPLTVRNAQVLEASVFKNKFAYLLATKPADSQTFDAFMTLRTGAANARLDEQISDIAGLLMVQQLSKTGLTAHAVEVLSAMRADSADKGDSQHATSPALDALAVKLHLDDTFGRHMSADEIVRTAYTLSAGAKIKTSTTDFSSASLQQLREAAILNALPADIEAPAPSL